MKNKSLNLLMIALLFSSCVSYKIRPVGQLTLASTRNIEASKEYKQLKTYAGISRTDIDASISTAKKGIIKRKNPIFKSVNEFKANSIDEAINTVVRSVAGGEYLTNVRIYSITQVVHLFNAKEITSNFVATGDVWGVDGENIGIKGFHVNDKVVFNYDKNLKKILKRNFKGKLNKQYTGNVIGLKGGFATVQLENKIVIDIPYANLTIIGSNTVK